MTVPVMAIDLDEYRLERILQGAPKVTALDREALRHDLYSAYFTYCLKKKPPISQRLIKQKLTRIKKLAFKLKPLLVPLPKHRTVLDPVIADVEALLVQISAADALVRWRGPRAVREQLGEKSRPAAGGLLAGLSARPPMTRKLGQDELSALEYLVGDSLAEIYEKHFGRKPTYQKNPYRTEKIGGAYIEFCEAFLREMKIPHSRKTIANALDLVRAGKRRRK
jgi:hypothetical protein